jgi:hypothetical protein
MLMLMLQLEVALLQKTRDFGGCVPAARSSSGRLRPSSIKVTAMLR